jgi:hypothetical protein
MHRCSKGWNAVAAVAVQWWRIKHLKLLVALLEVWWGSNEILGMPKGGLEPPCPFEHNALNVACLPISPLRLEAYITVSFGGCQ